MLCRDGEDFLFLWNSLFILAAITGIRIYCICLMSNHFHILITATPQQTECFMRLFKIRMGRYQKARYGKTVTAGLSYQLFGVSDRRAFCQEVAYILRNPYKARIASPFCYPWSSADAYFHTHKEEGLPVRKLSFREKNALLHTRQALPEGMRISQEGKILSGTAVDKVFVERLFNGSSTDFFDWVRKWGLDDLVEEKHGKAVTDSYSDEEVNTGIRELCRDLFSVPGADSLDRKSLSRLTRRIQARFGASRAQLLRLLPVDAFFLEQVL